MFKYMSLPGPSRNGFTNLIKEMWHVYKKQKLYTLYFRAVYLERDRFPVVYVSEKSKHPQIIVHKDPVDTVAAMIAPKGVTEIRIVPGAVKKGNARMEAEEQAEATTTATESEDPNPKASLTTPLHFLLGSSPDLTPPEIAAAEYGLIHIPLSFRPHSAIHNGNIPNSSSYVSPVRVGTMANGAGLALNTVDVLVKAGASPGNFMDTGGKATAESVREGFKILLEDEMVRVVLVNVFGGLTDCAVVAEGVINAVKEVAKEGRVEVVVRLRGTREVEARTMVSPTDILPFSNLKCIRC